MTEKNKLPQVYLDAEEIQRRVEELGQKITNDYHGNELVILAVLKGAFIFCADLIRHIDLPVKVDFIGLSSYGDGTESSGEVRITSDISGSLKNKHVLIVEDIVDTGTTLSFLKKLVALKGPKSIKIASLLFKPARLENPIDIDYLAFEIEDHFVVGYGLDFAEKYRELPYIGLMDTNPHV